MFSEWCRYVHLYYVDISKGKMLIETSDSMHLSGAQC